MIDLMEIIEELEDFAEFSRFDRRYTESYCKGCGMYRQDISLPFPHKKDCRWLELQKLIKKAKEQQHDVD